MINTDLLPGAPVCLNLVMNYVAFTATYTAIRIIMAAQTFLFVQTVAVDWELAITGTCAFAILVCNFEFNCLVIILAEVSSGHVPPTVGTGFYPTVIPCWGYIEQEFRGSVTQLFRRIRSFLV